MPASDTSAPIVTSEPSDRAASPQNPATEKLAMSTDSNVGPSKGRKPAWNVPSGTASPESACPIMGAAAWPALAATTPTRVSPKSSSGSSSSTDDLKSLSDGSAVSAPVVRKYVSSPEMVVVPAPEQPRPNPNTNPNLTRRGSTGSENAHSPLPNNRSSRWPNGPNRRGGNNNNSHHHPNNNNNNSRGGYRGRDRGGANWNPSWNNSPRPPYLYWGNQAMTTPPPPPPGSYGFGAHAMPSSFFASMGYEPPYAMLAQVPISAPQLVPQMAPPVFYSAEELEQRNSILKQIEYYFSEENLCRDTYLRRNMDNQGWVPISLIANFNRVKQLTNDLQLILQILNDSTVVEVQGNYLRRRNNWSKWLFPAPSQPENLQSQMQGLTIGHSSAISSHNI